jgi:hypothetical protein
MSLLATIEAKGVTLRLVDGKLRAIGPLTDEIRAVIREHRDELLATLGGGHEIKHTVASAISTESGPHPEEERRETADNGAGRIGARRPLASDLEAPQARAPATPTHGQATDVSVPPGHGRAQDIPSAPSGPIPWHDATPDDRAEIKTALFEGLPVQIYSKALGEIVWWALDDDVARKLKGGEFVREGYPPYRGEAIYAWSELLAVIGFPPDALKNLHEFKKAFDARISKPRVICSGCKHLAASYRHCLVRKDIRIANPDNPIECDSYRPR